MIHGGVRHLPLKHGVVYRPTNMALKALQVVRIRSIGVLHDVLGGAIRSNRSGRHRDDHCDDLHRPKNVSRFFPPSARLTPYEPPPFRHSVRACPPFSIASHLPSYALTSTLTLPLPSPLS